MRADESKQFESPNISSALSLECSSLHKRNRDVYVSEVKSMVFDDIVPLLKQKIQADLKKQMAELEKQLKEEKSGLLQKLRRQYLPKKEGLPTLSLLSYMSSQTRQGYLSKVKDKGMEFLGMGAPEASLSIRYSAEVIVLDKLFQLRLCSEYGHFELDRVEIFCACFGSQVVSGNIVPSCYSNLK